MKCHLVLLLGVIFFDLHFVLTKINIFVVDIIFIDKKFGELVNDDRKCIKEFGALRAKKIRIRLAQLSTASSLEEIRYVPGNYHELTSIRKGQWACDLDHPYRLIFTPLEYPIPTNEDGQYVWIEIKGVVIKEIVNYHKEK